MTKIDLDKLPEEDRKRVELIIDPRSSVLSLKFRENNIAAWKKAATRESLSLTVWIEKTLNKECLK